MMGPDQPTEGGRGRTREKVDPLEERVVGEGTEREKDRGTEGREEECAETE